MNKVKKKKDTSSIWLWLLGVLIIIVIICNIIYFYQSKKIRYDFGIDDKRFYTNKCYKDDGVLIYLI